MLSRNIYTYIYKKKEKSIPIETTTAQMPFTSGINGMSNHTMFMPTEMKEHYH